MNEETYAKRMVERCSEMIVNALQNMSIEDINMYQIGYEKGRADALVEKKYIIKEDGSIHSLDKDIEDAYNRGRADREKEVLTYLVNNGYIKYGFDEEYLAEQLKEKNK